MTRIEGSFGEPPTVRLVDKELRCFDEGCDEQFGRRTNDRKVAQRHRDGPRLIPDDDVIKGIEECDGSALSRSWLSHARTRVVPDPLDPVADVELLMIGHVRRPQHDQEGQ